MEWRGNVQPPRVASNIVAKNDAAHAGLARAALAHQQHLLLLGLLDLAAHIAGAGAGVAQVPAERHVGHGALLVPRLVDVARSRAVVEGLEVESYLRGGGACLRSSHARGPWDRSNGARVLGRLDGRDCARPPVGRTTGRFYGEWRTEDGRREEGTDSAVARDDDRSFLLWPVLLPPTSTGRSDWSFAPFRSYVSRE